MLVATNFNESTWDKFGLNWIRQAKAANLKAFIIGQDLPIIVQDKIKELGFQYFPQGKSKFHTLVENIQENCLFVEPHILPQMITSEKDVVCKKISLSPINFPISNLRKRADAVELLQGKTFFGLDFIYGSRLFWAGFLGFFDYVLDVRYMERNVGFEQAILNMYLSTFDSFSLEILS